MSPGGAPRLDSLGMWDAAAGLPEQLLEAAALAADLPPPVEPGTGRRRGGPVLGVAVLGSGTAALAGDALAMVAGDAMAVPLQVVQGFRLPAFVGPDWLVLALSASGETDETLCTANAALEAGARMVAVTGAGALAGLAADAGSVTVSLPDVPQPRVALGAMLAAALTMLERGGLLAGIGGTLGSCAAHLRRRRDEVVAGNGPAADLARRIGGTVPLVYGTEGPAELAARRWKAQVNENAKAPAFWASEPGAFHDEAAGWGLHGDVTRQLLTLVSLRHAGEHPWLASRAARLADTLLEVVADVLEVRAAGEDDLTRFLDLALLGDFVSLHLAASHGVDPGPVPVVDELAAAGGVIS